MKFDFFSIKEARLTRSNIYPLYEVYIGYIYNMQHYLNFMLIIYRFSL
jgi:hypothetical protein